MSQKDKSDKSDSSKNTPKNDAEKSASIDHAYEKAVTDRDPIPRQAPSWAKDLPKPKK